jgi:putative ABC transport system substrate-binding protein
VQRVDVLTEAALDNSLTAVLKERAEALIILPLPSIRSPQFQKIVEFAANNRLLTTTYNSSYFEAGLLMLYGPNVPDQYHRVGSYVDKILKGTRPVDLPIEQPRKIDFIVNQRRARALHLKIPPSVLERADQIIR